MTGLSLSRVHQYKGFGWYDAQTHLEKIYTEKAPNAVSWYRPHLETSLHLIEQTGAGASASIIDVGGGESTLVDDLLARGYENITVLDISQTAIDANRKRLGTASECVHWLVADITRDELGPSAYDVWHDRAVFHFLTSPSDRVAYVRQVARAVKHGGSVIVSTFGPEGPTKCSGLEVVRSDAESLHQQFGVRFRLLDSREEMHHTPFGVVQQFLYCLCRIE
ncbi:MAG: class I SAM-dependent methyltransferase [Steroidobacteraceae bacterium]